MTTYLKMDRNEKNAKPARELKFKQKYFHELIL